MMWLPNHPLRIALLLSSVVSHLAWADEERDPRLIPPGGTTPAYPSYENGVLYLPRVDTPEQMDTYQHVKLIFNEQIGGWELDSLYIPIPSLVEDVTINTVELLTTNSLPIQVFLKLDIDIKGECIRLGHINQQLNDNRFEINLSPLGLTTLTALAEDLPLISCGWFYTGNEPVYSYEKIIPLDVYGLAAGTYEYDVNNGQFVGTFSLSEDNVLDVCALTGEDCAEAE